MVFARTYSWSFFGTLKSDRIYAREVDGWQRNEVFLLELSVMAIQAFRWVITVQ